MKILLGIDGSRYSGEAVRLIRSLAPSVRRDRSFRVDLVAVVPEASSPRTETASSAMLSDSVPAPIAPRFEDRVTVEVASAWLAAATTELESVGIDVRAEIVHGIPEDVLVERCRAEGHDLVVAGVKGRGAAPFFEVGRVARHLVRSAPTSVLLVRERALRPGDAAASSGAGEATGFRVLVPTDGEPDSLEATWRMLESFTPSDAGVEIVRVVEPSEARTPIPAGEATWTTGSGEPRDPARRWASPDPEGPVRRRRVPKGTVLRGRPAAAIARWALSNQSDLVVLGLRKSEGAGPCLLGRTARELTWSAPCSVLMVRN